MSKSFAVIILILPFCCLTVRGQSAPSTFCSSTSGIDQLKAYVTCQESGKIDSCAGLATALGQRPPSEADYQRYLEIIERNQAPIVTALARKLHQLWRDKRKLKNPYERLADLNGKVQRLREARYPGEDSEVREVQTQGASLARAIAIRNANQDFAAAVYEPAVRFADGGVFDIANLDYDHLPGDYKQKNQLYAREVLRKYMSKRIGSDEKNLGYLVFDQTTSPMKEAVLESLKSNGTQALHEAIANQAETLVTEHMVEDLVNRRIGQRLGEGLHGILKEIPFIGKMPSWVKARLLSAGFVVVSEVLYPRIPSCMSSEHPSTHMEVNRWTEGCHSVYQVNENVIAFLQMSAERQLTELKDPRACSFYQKFHNAVLNQPKFTGLTCHGDRSFELTTESTDGDVIEHKVLYWPGTRNIREIAIRPRRLNPHKKELRPKAASLINLTSSGDIVNMANSESIQSAVMPLRLYIMDAHGCCNAKNEDYKTQCLAAYNRQSDTDGAQVSSSEASAGDAIQD